MGVIGDALNDIFNGIEHFVAFFILYSLIVFVLGNWYTLFVGGTNYFWYPMYVLFIALLIYVLSSLGKKPAKK